MDKLVFKLFCLALLAILLAGCGTGYSIKEAPRETNKEPKAFFCPKDDCGKVYSAFIKSANYSVHCAFYDIDLSRIIGSLANKSKKIEVMLVMDSSNYDEQIIGEGVRLDDNSQLMHNKFCVIDENTVITGSFNPTENDNYKNANNVIVIYSKIIAANYEEEFEELWNGEFGSGKAVSNPNVYINSKRVENYFCPEDKCASRIVDLVKGAKRSVYFMAFSFTNEDIGNALISKNKLEIGGIFDSQQASSRYSQFKRLKESGLDVRKDADKYKMHHKVFIVDNETVVTGSFNPTLSADTRNDENLLIIHDKKVADAFLDEFDRLWR